MRFDTSSADDAGIVSIRVALSVAVDALSLPIRMSFLCLDCTVC